MSLASIALAGENPSSVPPLVETKSVKVIGIAMENDGTALKPGIQFDERMKRNVGLKQLTDLKFVKSNPSPTAEFLRENVITEANVSFVTTLCNTISMPVAVTYQTKGDKTGEDMKELLLGQIKTLQLCKGCLERTPANELTVEFPEGLCRSSCKECLHVQRITNQAISHVSVPATGVCRMEESVNGAWFLFLQLIAKKVTRKRWS